MTLLDEIRRLNTEAEEVYQRYSIDSASQLSLLPDSPSGVDETLVELGGIVAELYQLVNKLERQVAPQLFQRNRKHSDTPTHKKTAANPSI